MTVKLYNPRALLRGAAKKMLTDAMDPDNVVLFRAGSTVVKGQQTVLGGHGHAANVYGDELMGKVFKLVECTPAEIVGYQKQLNNEAEQEGPQA
ncbi:hypothetical protein HWC07_gp131 [Pantoea phage vB_PagM_LIET2]|uniref:Uncharacterized protein n=1 Tax=Pantoea phage vB_PagM_LIET2 TaxID=2508071 RepID=A0A411AWA2_9CAUD|nr:hypothetical protein HWC07_gp131 [Pantoea phage vB_PagM_LIET2]QAX92383.1 hypothetical protein LIET2_gp131 [Pantoea phage vB_PagM_LIET2]UJH96028.1 hypothetical protein [Pantoea phage Nafs113]